MSLTPEQAERIVRVLDQISDRLEQHLRDTADRADKMQKLVEDIDDRMASIEESVEQIASFDDDAGPPITIGGIR